MGLLNKTVKYYSVDYNDSINPSSWIVKQKHKTSIENFKPAKIIFLNQICFIAFDDYTKVYDFMLDSKRPILLDIITKPIGKLLDFQISSDYSQIYAID